MTNRFSVKNGKFGAYFFDEHDKKELTLEDVKNLLNEYIPPGLPKSHPFINNKMELSDLPPFEPKNEPIVMDGNHLSMHSGMGFR